MKNTLYLGLDLGSHAGKAIVIDTGLKNPAVIAHHSFLLSEEGKPKARSEWPNILKKELESIKKFNPTVHLAVSGNDVIVRYLEMPQLSLNELKNSLPYEADRYLPFQLTDAYFSVDILQESLPLDKHKMWVVLVAAKKTFIDDRLNLMKEIDFYPSCIEPTQISLMNAYHFFVKTQDQAVLLIDIGSHISAINGINGPTPYFSREKNFGSDQITQTLMKHKKINYQEAEKIKWTEGIDWEDPLLVKPIQPLIKELKSSLDYFEEKLEKGVEKILLTGGGGRLLGLSEYLAKEVHRATELFSPLDQLEKRGEERPSSLTSQAYTVACGLAVREAKHD